MIPKKLLDNLNEIPRHDWPANGRMELIVFLSDETAQYIEYTPRKRVKAQAGGEKQKQIA